MSDTEAAVDAADDLRATLTKAFENPDPTPAQPETLPAESPAEPQQDGSASDGRARDDKGRFVKTAAEQAAEDAAAKAPVDGDAEKAVAPKDTQERIAPPPNWKGGAKIRWEKLPRDVQQEILSDYQRFESDQGRFAPLAQILEPRRQALTATYGSVENAVTQLFALSDYASQNPREFIQWFAQQRGIDLGAQGTDGQPADTAPDPLQARLEKLEQTLTGFTNHFQQSQNSVYSREIEAFAADPKHPYFNDVKAHMAALLGQGLAKDLQDAYDQAVYANPSVRAQLLESERQAQEDERRKKAEQAKAAAASITGSPVPGASPPAESADDLRGFLAKQFYGNRA